MKDFLANGAFLQTGDDVFTLLTGPFIAVSSEKLSEKTKDSYLIKSDFWDFLDNPENIALNSVYRAESAHSLSKSEFIGLISDLASDGLVIDWLAPQVLEFQEQFVWSFKQFESGKLEKTVPIILQNGRMKTDSEARAYMLRHLLQQNSYGWSYGFFQGEQAMLGHTPEILMHWDLKTKLGQTVALAGTVSVGVDAHREILADPKIRREHSIVIEDIKIKLQHLNPIQDDTHVLALKHLLHLKTDFRMHINSRREVMLAVQSLHPTAAMGVFPSSSEALRQMAQLPLQKCRGAFAAPFGIATRDDFLIVVAIRNAILRGDEVSLFSGCGVTVDSSLAAELNELESKRNSVKKLMGMMK